MINLIKSNQKETKHMTTLKIFLKKKKEIVNKIVKEYTKLTEMIM